MMFEEGDYILGMWNGWRPEFEVLITVIRRASAPPTTWELECRSRVVLDEKRSDDDVFDSVDRKRSWTAFIENKTEDEVMLDVEAIHRDMCSKIEMEGREFVSIRGGFKELLEKLEKTSWAHVKTVEKGTPEYEKYLENEGLDHDA